LSALTGTQVLLLVASETGHVYTFATPKLQPLITKPEGKNLIQTCLNAPDIPQVLASSQNQQQSSPISNTGPTVQQSRSFESTYYDTDKDIKVNYAAPNNTVDLSSYGYTTSLLSTQQQQQHQQQQHRSYANSVGSSTTTSSSQRYQPPPGPSTPSPLQYTHFSQQVQSSRDYETDYQLSSGYAWPASPFTQTPTATTSTSTTTSSTATTSNHTSASLNSTGTNPPGTVAVLNPTSSTSVSQKQISNGSTSE